MAKKLGLTERQVQKWFVHRREKLRRLEKKAFSMGNTHTNTDNIDLQKKGVKAQIQTIQRINMR